jgi:hypothetical protein
MSCERIWSYKILKRKAQKNEKKEGGLPLTVDYVVWVAAAVIAARSAVGFVVVDDSINHVHRRVVAWATEELVVSCVARPVAEQSVIAVFAMYYVASVLAIQPVVSGSAEDDVIAICTEYFINAIVPVELVVSSVSVHMVIIQTASDDVVA